ncbi:MAG TPA: hypothetical protein PKD09_09460 [Aggregatilinea sp.]|uniref:hypothetical protein n=1 Tax=Aggregatilinea sp. TaxID=2806333 RepID=UPI002C300B6E|nr:hypothetical protein [Aggregatilinea sp.]HML21864.1 hypothetical protein [Aggregatilinea sp.]
MLTYDPATRTVTMNLTSLEHCGFDHEQFDDELFIHGYESEEARAPEKIIVIMAPSKSIASLQAWLGNNPDGEDKAKCPPTA